jgi:hypothetical protein
MFQAVLHVHADITQRQVVFMRLQVAIVASRHPLVVESGMKFNDTS